MTMPAQKPHRSRQDFETPRIFLDAVEYRWGKLTADLACTVENAKAPLALVQSLTDVEWPVEGNLWLNPPFADIDPWARRCAAWRGRQGARLFLLTPASVGANWFADHVYGRAMVYALSPRLKFVGAKDQYPKDLILSVYGDGPGFAPWRWTGARKEWV